MIGRAVFGAMLAASPTAWGAPSEAEGWQITLIQSLRSCKRVSSCEEAVRMWCDGYRRADGDGDGIPCENVCSSLEEVERIRAAIGC